MSILFLFGFQLLSLGIFAIVATLGIHGLPINLLRIALSMLILPAFLAALLLFNIIFINNTIISFRVFLSSIPIDFGCYLTTANAIITLTSLISLILLVFILPKKHIGSNLALFGGNCLALLLSQAPANLIFSFCIFISWSILVFYFGILDNDKKFINTIPASDFLWQRASDILAFLSLLLIFSNQKTAIIYELNKIPPSCAAMFFIAMVMRIINLPAGKNHIIITQELGFHPYFLGRIYISLGALLLLIRYQNIIFPHSSLKVLHIAISSILLCHAFFYNLKHKKLIHITTNISYLACSIIIFLMAMNKFLAAETIIYLSILIIPFFSAVISDKKYIIKKSSEPMHLSDDLVGVIGIFARSLTNLGASISTNFISLFYANFLLYRLPQIILGLVQLPLRIFHTGSLQRSMLLIALLVTSYYWLWS